MYVLEVNAGFIAAHQISLGDKFNFVMFALPMAEASAYLAVQLTSLYAGLLVLGLCRHRPRSMPRQ
jgi:hypothetical protein